MHGDDPPQHGVGFEPDWLLGAAGRLLALYDAGRGRRPHPWFAFTVPITAFRSVTTT